MVCIISDKWMKWTQFHYHADEGWSRFLQQRDITHLNCTILPAWMGPAVRALNTVWLPCRRRCFQQRWGTPPEWCPCRRRESGRGPWRWPAWRPGNTALRLPSWRTRSPAGSETRHLSWPPVACEVVFERMCQSVSTSVYITVRRPASRWFSQLRYELISQ